MTIDEKEEFGKRMEHLLTEISTCSKLLGAEIGKLTGMKGELSGIEKELERTKAILVKKQDLSEEEARKAEGYLTDLKYLKAEFGNYKRRAEKDKRSAEQNA
jgi:molecular chaperone GrpE (heat shock protein)